MINKQLLDEAYRSLAQLWQKQAFVPPQGPAAAGAGQAMTGSPGAPPMPPMGGPTGGQPPSPPPGPIGGGDPMGGMGGGLGGLDAILSNLGSSLGNLGSTPGPSSPTPEEENKEPSNEKEETAEEGRHGRGKPTTADLVQEMYRDVVTMKKLLVALFRGLGLEPPTDILTESPLERRYLSATDEGEEIPIEEAEKSTKTEISKSKEGPSSDSILGGNKGAIKPIEPIQPAFQEPISSGNLGGPPGLNSRPTGPEQGTTGNQKTASINSSFSVLDLVKMAKWLRNRSQGKLP